MGGTVPPDIFHWEIFANWEKRGKEKRENGEEKKENYRREGVKCWLEGEEVWKWAEDLFVSPEFSSERDYVITHSVRSMYVVCSIIVCTGWVKKKKKKKKKQSLDESHILRTRKILNK